QKASKDDCLVMELSSFQLMGTYEFHPHIAVITNIYEAHLDYHGTREAYIKAKWKIQQNMTENDYLVINFNEEEWQNLAKQTKATVLPFSTKEKVQGAYLENGHLYYKGEFILSANELGVPGKHNIENALAAIAVAKIQEVDNETIAKALREFSGVKHRTQYIGTINDVKFYNDSKATNILATQMALGGFDPKHLILLAGGLDRGNEFDELIPDIKYLKAIYLFGETKYKLQRVAKEAGIPVIQLTENVESGLYQAIEISQPGDTILLSPANASWYQYPNFEE